MGNTEVQVATARLGKRTCPGDDATVGYAQETADVEGTTGGAQGYAAFGIKGPCLVVANWPYFQRTAVKAEFPRSGNRGSGSQVKIISDREYAAIDACRAAVGFTTAKGQCAAARFYNTAGAGDVAAVRGGCVITSHGQRCRPQTDIAGTR